MGVMEWRGSKEEVVEEVKRSRGEVTQGEDWSAVEVEGGQGGSSGENENTTEGR